MTIFKSKKYWLILLSIALFNAAILSPLYAGQSKYYAIENNTLTLDFKGHDSFFYQEDQFFIDKKTIIINTDASKTTFDSLAFPCIAKVRYRVMSDNKRVCEKIVIKRYLKRK